MNEIDEINARMEKAKQINPQIEHDMQAAIQFANENLTGKSHAFTGALLGLLVGAMFTPQPIENFDQWCKLVRADMARRKQSPGQAGEAILNRSKMT